MKCAKVFVFLRIGVKSVIEPDWADRQFVTQTESESVAHFVEAWMFGGRQKISGIEKRCALKLAVNRKRVFNIEDRVKFAADWISFRIERAEVALTKTADA